MKLSTVDCHGGTMVALVVAPPAAKLYARRVDVLYCEARYPTQFRPPLAVQPGSGGLPNGLLEEGLVDEISKPVWEYESPKVMRNLRAQLSGSAVLELEVELVVVVRVEVTSVVVEVDVVMTAAEEDVLVGPAVLLSVPGMH
jgi:hypothetical protein